MRRTHQRLFVIAHFLGREGHAADHRMKYPRNERTIEIIALETRKPLFTYSWSARLAREPTSRSTSFCGLGNLKRIDVIMDISSV